MEVLECHWARTDLLSIMETPVPEPEELFWELDTNFSSFFDLSHNDSDCDFVLDYPIYLHRILEMIWSGTETVISVLKSQLWKCHSVTYTLTGKPNTIITALLQEN